MTVSEALEQMLFVVGPDGQPTAALIDITTWQAVVSMLEKAELDARGCVMRLWVEPSALDEIAALPGYVRQRVRRAVSDLRKTARPSQSRTLEIPDDVELEGLEARRLRLDNWRIVYVPRRRAAHSRA